MSDAGRTCGSCRFFDPHESLCRFTSPHASLGWPSTNEHEWCGEWAAPRTAKQVGEADAIKPTLMAERREAKASPRRQGSLGGLR